MLAHLLRLRNVPAVVTSFRMLSSELAERLQEKPWTALCISVLSPGSMRHAEALRRRLGACDPGRALVGQWTSANAAATTGTSFTSVGSLADAAKNLDELSQLDTAPPTAEPAPVAVPLAAL
jgi:hypothetical protein